MEAIMFDIYGKFAHFKNPESNVKLEVSFENMPKTALVGSLGAILGLKGRGFASQLGYIEYWEKLKGIKVSIVPAKARWRKHIDELVNATGFANVEANGGGGNQVVRRQILEDVRWTIYLQQGDVEDYLWAELRNSLLARKSKFPLYLGKTGFVARLGQVSVVALHKTEGCNVEKCDSLVCADVVSSIEKELNPNHILGNDNLFERNDYMPIELDKRGLYILKKFIYSNSYIEVDDGEFYADNGRILYFF